MRFNWQRYPIYLSEEVAKTLGGEYTKWGSLVKQIRFTKNLLIVITYLIIFLSLISVQLKKFIINDLQGANSGVLFQRLTLIDIFNSNYLGLEKSSDINRDKLFFVSIYVLAIKSILGLFISIFFIYILKLRQARSLWIRSRLPKVPLELREPIRWMSTRIALYPFPILTCRKLSSLDLPNRTPVIPPERIGNIISDQQKFPILQKTDRPYPLVRVKGLSFMYHGDNDWDKLFHAFLRKFFPARYKAHLLKNNTLNKFQEDEKTSLEALKNVSLNINAGKFTTILGCNGSSKSTLVKLMIKLLEKYSGHISWHKKDLKNISTKSFYKNVAYISQENIIHNEISVYDYVACGLFPSFKFFKFQYPKDHPTILENLEKMEVLQFKDKDIKKLSGGEKQKVILARVLTQQTPIIVLDEPTTYLDISNQYKILTLLKKLQTEENKTIIAILHDIQQAKQFSDEIILMDNGRVFEYGETEKVLSSNNVKRVFGIENF